MNDERKLCARCKHEHEWGVLRYSADNVRLYGARRCREIVHEDPGEYATQTHTCGCDSFVEAVAGMENLPALSAGEVKALWEQTSFLNAQVPMATRIMVRQIMALGDGKSGTSLIGRFFGKGDGKTPMERQWPEFMGLMISQLTDIRGAMVRDDSKFAHLVAHTDEILEGMKGAVQLAERLTGMNRRIDDTNERLGKIEGMLRRFLERQETEAIMKGVLEQSGSEPVHDSEARRDLRAYVNAPIRDEAVVVDGTPLDPTGEFRDDECSRCHTIAFGTGGSVCPYCGAGGPNPKPLRYVEGMGYMTFDAADKAE